MRPAALFLLLLLPLAGCGDGPDLQAADSDFVKQAGYPTLVPLEELGLARDPEDSEDQASGLESRAQALRNRARRLQGDVIDDADRQRLNQGVVEG